MRKLHIISCVEDIPRFLWETAVQLNNARKYSLSDKFRVIVFLPAHFTSRGFNPEWKKLEKLFPETKFFYHTDPRGGVTDLMVTYNYLPIHRLCSLEKHFKDHPELEKDAILYIDSDVVFTSEPQLEQYLDDEVNYLSDTHTYLNANYIENNAEKVIEEKKEEYLKKNVLSQVASLCKIDPEIIKSNNDNTGGAQYLLKNVNSKFFHDCIETCLLTRMYFQTLNQQYFAGETVKEREDRGIQSWCADMWAIQWELWKKKMPSQTPKWMDFAWATDEISKLERVWMLHNAGIVDDKGIRITKEGRSVKDEDNKPIIIQAPAFWKDGYKRVSVFSDMETIKKIVEHPDSQLYCTSVYAKEIVDTYNNLIKTKENE